MEIVIQKAVEECNELGIVGKDITPFLLRQLMAGTKGGTLKANIALIEDNARVGAEIAVVLTHLSDAILKPPATVDQSTDALTLSPPSEGENVDILVIGSIAVDLTCTIPTVSASNPMLLRTSQSADMHTSSGGVGHNIALAATYASSKRVRLVTALGSDFEGTWLREYAKNAGLDVAVIPCTTGTAKYAAIHDKDGGLVTASADMRILEELKGTEIQKEIRRGKPKLVAFDGNLSPSAINHILEEIHPKPADSNSSIQQPLVLFEPTSVPKASRIFKKPVNLDVFPTHSINIVTPNMFELKAMHQAAEENGHFENPEWWNVLNSFQINSEHRHGWRSSASRG